MQNLVALFYLILSDVSRGRGLTVTKEKVALKGLRG